METYLLFAGENYYPLGGWKDFVGSYPSVDAAKAILEVPRKDSMGYMTDDDWAHIVHEGKIVLSLAKDGGKWIETKED